MSDVAAELPLILQVLFLELGSRTEIIAGEPGRQATRDKEHAQ
jgi:hypothetical protein